MGVRRSVADRSGPEYLTNRRRQELAFQRRLGGMTLQQIADSPDPDHPGRPLYASRGGVLKAIRTATARHTGADDTTELRALEGARLDRLQRAVWGAACRGDLPAIDRVLAIMAQRAKLLGLNRPGRHRVEVITEDAVDAAIRELEAQIAATAPRGWESRPEPKTHETVPIATTYGTVPRTL